MLLKASLDFPWKIIFLQYSEEKLVIIEEEEKLQKEKSAKYTYIFFLSCLQP